jgi:hypothetical protein
MPFFLILQKQVSVLALRLVKGKYFRQIVILEKRQ